MCARFRENVRSLKDLKISLFPLSRVKGAEAQKNTFRVTVIFFLVSSAQKFLVFLFRHFGKKKQKEDMRRAL